MSDTERTRPFSPEDNAVPLGDIDWKTRYDEMKTRNWDEKRDFVGMKRLGRSYHIMDPFFKFESCPEENKTFDKLWYPFYAFCGFTGSYLTASYVSGRPLYSGLLPALIAGLLGMGAGFYAYDNQMTRSRDRDAVLLHYILLHENEFPKVERKKWGEIMKPWIPFRTMDSFAFKKANESED